jgi:hypothetical protein
MISLDQKVGGEIHAQHLCDLTVSETVYLPENGCLDIPGGYPGGGRSPTLGFAVFEERHQLVQDLNELVDVGAGFRYEIPTLFECQVIEAGAVIAQQHQCVVEGLVVAQILENRSQVFPCVSVL